MNVSRGSFPGRGLLYSFLAHEIWVFGLLFLSFLPSSVSVPASTEDVEMINLRDQRAVTYLPRLGGGHEGSGHPGGVAGGAGKRSPGRPARSSKGFSYRGPQPVVSDSPNPTKGIQTILQPALKKPRILRSLVPLPNMVQVARVPRLPAFVAVKPDAGLADEAKPARPSPVRPKLQANKPILPTVRPPQKAVIEAPKLTLPTSELQPTLVEAASKPKVPVADMIEKLKRPRRAEQNSLSAANGTDARDLLSLSPVPVPPERAMQIPLGEARGRFAISPGPPAPFFEAEPGASREGLSSAAVGLGSSSGVVPANAAGGSGGSGSGTGGSGAGAASGGDGMSRGVGGGAGGGVGGGTGKGYGAGNGGSGGGAGRGAGTGAGIGDGPGSGTGSGSGAGSGYGSGGFPGITIQGGSLEGGAAGQPISRMATPAPPLTSYNLTIVSTASSGGGLGDYGVFSHEQVYTVYIDMRQTPEAATPSWTLQCAVLRRAGATIADGRVTSPNQEGFMAPIPIVKEMPDLPANLVQQYLRRLVVVYGVIDTAGKLKQLAVIQSPDAQISLGMMEALNKWVFHPAELNGQPVPVKVLLGIPLSLQD